MSAKAGSAQLRHDSSAAMQPSERLVAWLRHDALPTWLEKGWDAKKGGFHEAFFFDGSPDTLVLRSTAVQWQQIYIFASAWHYGWCDGMRLALRGVERMIEKAWAPDGKPGFVHMLSPSGTVAEAQRVAIDHAYAIMALTALTRATGDPKLRALLDMVIGYVDSTLTDAQGYPRESDGSDDRHSQATILALLQAYLCAVESLGHAEAALRATRLRRLLETTLLDKANGTVAEAYDYGWKPISEDANGAVVIPGHMAEWTCLLRRYERLYAQKASPLGTHFLGAALRATEPTHGFLMDAITSEYQIVSAKRSLWAQSALIRAWLAQAEAGVERAHETSDQLIEAFMETFLSGPFTGGWYEKFGVSGDISIDTVPSSALFNIFLIAEDSCR